MPLLAGLGVLVAIALGWGLRWHALTTLSVDYDEDDYLRAAQQYAALIRSGDLAGITQVNYREEHPPLSKLFYALTVVGLPPAQEIPDRPTSADPNRDLPRDMLRSARTGAAVLGTLTVALLALVDPLAGIFLAAHAFTIKYTTQVMLEALPALSGFLIVLFYLRWKRRQTTTFDAWLALSALFLGLTAAAKYIYAVIGLAVLLDWFLTVRERETLRRFIFPALAWGLLSLVVFFAANPYLWPDPAGRLRTSVLYHASYSTSASEVQQANFPVWQPLVWLNTSPAGLGWQPEAFPVALDLVVLVLACFGLASLWRRERVYVLWLILAFGFLLLWPTKWPQYILTLTVPLSLAAAEGFYGFVFRPIASRLAARGVSRPPTAARSELKRALPWLIPGTAAFVLLTVLPLFFQLAVSFTDFNAASIRDGLQGGILRETWAGLTGRVRPIDPVFPFRATKVSYTGPVSYFPVLNYITTQGILVFNVLWTLLSVGLQSAVGIGAALLLSRRGIVFRRFWQALFILPWAVPEMIGALMWFNIFAPDIGWLSLAVREYGPGFPLAFLRDWINNPNVLLLVLLIAGVWYGFPFMMLVAMTGLKMVPKDAYDAAAMDGATAWNTFRFVTWPLLIPLLVPAFIVRGVFAFNQFYLFQAFYFPESTLATLSYNFFNPSGYFINGQFAISATINILTLLILVVFVSLFNRWSKAGEGVSYA